MPAPHLHTIASAAMRLRQMAQVVGDARAACIAEMTLAALSARAAPLQVRPARHHGSAAGMFDGITSHLEKARRGREMARLHFLIGNIEDSIRFAAPAAAVQRMVRSSGLPEACLVEAEARLVRGDRELALALAAEAARVASLIRRK